MSKDQVRSEGGAILPVQEMTGDSTIVGAWTKTLVGCLAYLVSFSAYLMCLAPSVYVGDSGELIAAADSLGIAHPPGYPLFCIVNKLVILLFPIANVAYRTNICAALIGAAGAAVIALILLELLRRTPMWMAVGLSLSGALALGFAKTVWYQCVETEVYPLNLLFVAWAILLFMRWMRHERVESLLCVALVLGVGMANHLTMTLVIGTLLIYLFIFKPQLAFKPSFLIGVTMIATIGSMLYMYFPFRSLAQPIMNWGSPDNTEAIFDHIFRRQYGKLSGKPHEMSLFLKQLQAYGWLLGAQFPWPFFLMVPFGLLYLWRQRKMFLLMGGLYVALTMGFIYPINFDIIPLQLIAIEVFFIPSYIMIVIWMVLGVVWWWERLRPLQALATASGVAAMAALVYVPWSANLFENDHKNYHVAYDCGMNIVDTMEPNAIWFGIGDDIVFPFAYLYMSEAFRRDVKPYDDLGCVFDNIYGRDFLKHAARDRDIKASGLQKGIVAYSDRPVYHVLGSQLANTSGIYRTTVGILHRVYRPDRGEAEPKFAAPWARYRMRGIDDKTVFKDYLSRDIVAQYYFFQGEYFYRKNMERESDRAYAKAISAGEGIDWVYNNITILLNERRRFDKAIALAQWAVGVNPTNADAWNNLGIAYFHQQKYDDSINAYKETLKLNQMYAKAYNNMGNAYLAKGDAKSAIENYNYAVQIDPGYAEAYANMGIAYYRTRKLDDAIRAYTNATMLLPGYADAFCNLGVAYQEKGDTQNAMIALQRAVSINPNHEIARFNLGITYFALRRYQEAIQQWMEVKRINPGNAAADQFIQKARAAMGGG